MENALDEQIRSRAEHCCEYCQLPEALADMPFQIDHIIAIKHGGATILENLALSCFACNSYKGPNIAGIDPATGRVVRLFHPRRDSWANHFGWIDGVIFARTIVGRATIHVLNMNHPDAVFIRGALSGAGLFPPRLTKK
jgi:hypothetical protein